MAQPGGMQIVSVRCLVLRNALIVSRDFDECKIPEALNELDSYRYVGLSEVESCKHKALT